ncbi:MAG: hypothetical protein ACKUBY_03980 [Candidatus Moraniibacteriota bacterium]|jgi:hypothetical protein
MRKHSERKILEMTVEITKEYARGGGTIHLDSVLKKVHEELTKINEKIEEENA